MQYNFARICEAIERGPGNYHGYAIDSLEGSLTPLTSDQSVLNAVFIPPGLRGRFDSYRLAASDPKNRADAESVSGLTKRACQPASIPSRIVALSLGNPSLNMNLISHLYRLQLESRERLAGQRHRLMRGRAKPAAPVDNPHRIVVVIAGLLGDSVMSTPILIEARRLWANARITLLGQARNCSLLGACPHIDDFYETPALPFSIRGRRGVDQMEQWLRSQEFDLAILALGDHFAALMAKVGIPARVGLRGSLLEPCLTHAFEIGCPSAWGPSERLNSLRVLGYQVRDVPPELWVSEQSRLSGRERLSRLGLEPETPYAILHPFGSTPAQWWPLDRAGELTDGLLDEHNLRTIVIGGPETRGRLGAGIRNTIDATGAFTIPELMAVIENAELVISTDSGPFHIAGAGTSTGRHVSGPTPRTCRPLPASQGHFRATCLL